MSNFWFYTAKISGKELIESTYVESTQSEEHTAAYLLIHGEAEQNLLRQKNQTFFLISDIKKWTLYLIKRNKKIKLYSSFYLAFKGENAVCVH